MDKEIKKGASFQQEKETMAASLEGAKRRMHQYQRIKWSHLMSEQKVKKPLIDYIQFHKDRSGENGSGR